MAIDLNIPKRSFSRRPGASKRGTTHNFFDNNELIDQKTETTSGTLKGTTSETLKGTT